MSRKDTATLVSLVGPIAHRLYYQFARVSVRMVMDRRDIVLDAMRLPEHEVKCRFSQLPVSSEDIFGGQFDSQLQAEVKRKKNLLKANLSNPRILLNSRQRQSRPQSQQRRQSSSVPSSFPRRPPPPPTSGPRQQRHPQRSFVLLPSRGNYRPSASGRGRGFSEP